MTSEDIVILIETCKNAGVSKFKFEKLEVHFYPQDRPDFRETATQQVPPSHADRAIEKEIEEDEELQALALENLMIENPLAYEAAMRKSNGSFGERS